ncbi:DUF805 domain-containing protein [Enterococcus sp. 669A]|uniref:DUF805 domain-containing protein n=1 Tax=Candidatus Enterococcus moelleringii TaxID=2815325 RepID=A0ABS3L5F0_9ENTE|nr:DUF805 domain-containing protein [Enterococcus sp. 669A]MBO1304837.1 DUF805 domain-containing protein [Enterococcus sp. 669A]
MHKKNQLSGKVGFIRALMDYVHGYADFKGRTTRAGFWWVNLVIAIFHLLFFLVLFQADLSIMWDAVLLFRYGYLDQNGINKETLTSLLHVLPLLVFYGLICLGILIPSIALFCRRMRDAGLKGRGFAVHCAAIGILLALQYAIHLQKKLVGLSSFGELIMGACIFLTSCLAVELLIFTFLPSNWLTTTSKKPLAQFFFRRKPRERNIHVVEKPVKIKMPKQTAAVAQSEPVKQPQARVQKIEEPKIEHKRSTNSSAGKKKLAQFLFQTKAPESSAAPVVQPVKAKVPKPAESVVQSEPAKQSQARVQKIEEPKIEHKRSTNSSAGKKKWTQFFFQTKAPESSAAPVEQPAKAKMPQPIEPVVQSEPGKQPQARVQKIEEPKIEHKRSTNSSAGKKKLAQFLFQTKAPESSAAPVEQPAKAKMPKQATAVVQSELVKQPQAKEQKSEEPKIKHKKPASSSEKQNKKRSEGLLVELSRGLNMGRYLNTAFYAIFFCLITAFLGIGFGGVDEVTSDVCFFLAFVTYVGALLLFLLQMVVNLVGSFRSFQISTEQIVLVCACLGIVSMYTGNAAFSLIITLVVLFLDKKTYQMLLKSNITKNFEYTLSFFKLIWITFYGAMYAVGEFHSVIYSFGAKCMNELYTTPFFTELASDLFPTLCTFILWPILLLVLHVVVSFTVQSNKKHTTNRKLDEGIILSETNPE